MSPPVAREPAHWPESVPRSLSRTVQGLSRYQYQPGVQVRRSVTSDFVAVPEGP